MQKITKEKFLITTAIVYASQIPHIGNDYEIILADALARFKRLDNYKVFFQTGTDEHGLKIEKAATLANKEPKVFVDEIVSYIKETYKMLNIQYDCFIRTTSQKHTLLVQKIYRTLAANKDIYLSKYDGWYSLREEAFIKEDELVNGVTVDGDIPIWMSEESYFLNLKKYQSQLTEHIKTTDNFIVPDSRKNEMLNNFLNKPMSDLSVTRTKMSWGIPLDFNKSHVAYVWIDALSNYLSGLGYDPTKKRQSALFRQFWPADVQIIGKDILRFHVIYWPIILMALGLKLPKTIFGHPWILLNDKKMSKSWGNTLRTREIIKRYGVDCVRYYCLHEIPFKDDGNLTHELLMQRHNSDLTNTVGNLLNRTLGMILKYQNGHVKRTTIKTLSPLDVSLKKSCLELIPKMRAHIDKLEVGLALECVIDLARTLNKYIDQSAPWVLFKTPNNEIKINHIMYMTVEGLRFVVYGLLPFIPDAAMKMAMQLKLNITSFKNLHRFSSFLTKTLSAGVPVFERFDIPIILKEINTKVDSKS